MQDRNLRFAMAIRNKAALLENIRALPPDKITEVEDFVEFLRFRTDDQTLVQAAAKLSESSFAEVWDNPSDSVYDKL
jgi:hypothetical protein